MKNWQNCLAGPPGEIVDVPWTYITRPLKIEAQCQLPRTIATKSLRQRARQHSESAWLLMFNEGGAKFG
jgi:hypothetical protein